MGSYMLEKTQFIVRFNTCIRERVQFIATWDHMYRRESPIIIKRRYPKYKWDIWNDLMVCLATWNSILNVELGQILCLANLEFENRKLGQFRRIAITM